MKKESPGRLLIFDYDGVIADSFDAIAKVLMELGEQYGLHFNDKEELRTLYHGNFYERLLERGMTVEDREAFIQEEKKRWISIAHTIKPFEAIVETIRKLSGHSVLAIVSSNSNEYISRLLQRHNVLKHISVILGVEAGIGKVKKIRSVIKQLQADPGKTYYIGDTSGDIEEGRAAGVKTVAVTWGFHPEALLFQARPDHLAKNIYELRNIFI